MSRALRPGAVLNGYRIEGVLSEAGNFAVVYLATDLDGPRFARREERIAGRLGRWGDRYGPAAAKTALDAGPLVAIKEYLPREYGARAANGTVVASPGQGDVFAWGRERFAREGAFLAEHSHPNVVAIFDTFKAFGTEYYVMERLAAGSLSDIIHHGGAQNEEQVRRWLLPLLEGLASVERRDANHLDLSPGNIMFRTSGDPVLVDFGAARIGGSPPEHSSHFVIDDNFAAPEKYKVTSRGLDSRADIYSLGGIVNFALTGELPAKGNERIATGNQAGGLSQAAYARRAKMASGDFLKAIDRAFAPESRQRFDNAAAMLQTLSKRGLLQGGGSKTDIGGRNMNFNQSPQGDERRNVLLVVILGIAAFFVLMIVLAIWAL